MKKSTHTIQDIENWMFDLATQIQNAETKTEKHALTKKLKTVEAHYNSCKDKEINGKAYPVKKQPKDIPKKELLALIEDIEPVLDYSTSHREQTKYNIERELDVSGVSVGSNRFTFIE